MRSRSSSRRTSSRRTPPERRNALLETIRRRVELHGWKLSLHERGLAVAHDDHSIVLGLPATLREYVAE